MSFGLLNVQTEKSHNFASKNLTVGRAAYDVTDESALGVIFTNGDPLQNRANHLGGMDWQYKTANLWGGNQVLEAATYFMRTFTHGRAGNAVGGRLLYPNFTYGADTSEGRWRPTLSQVSNKLVWTFRF